MRSAVLAVLLLVAYCEARPRLDLDVRPTFGSGSSYIIGGENANSGEYPWQLSQQRRNASGTWSHSCGASLLSSVYALSAAHCVSGASVADLRVIAGVIDRTSTNGGALAYLASYKTHEQYVKRDVTISDDIAILTLASPIYANGVTIQYAKLPENNDDLFVGREGVITGWGRIDTTLDSPLILQKARVGVIGSDRCNQLLREAFPFRNMKTDDTQICLYDEVQKRTACQGDSGGPFNLDNGSAQAIVAGVTSWSPKNELNECLPGVPTMYTRTSYYLDWIKTNTP